MNLEIRDKFERFISITQVFIGMRSFPTPAFRTPLTLLFLAKLHILQPLLKMASEEPLSDNLVGFDCNEDLVNSFYYTSGEELEEPWHLDTE